MRKELSHLKDRLNDKWVKDPSALLLTTERQVDEKRAALVDLEEELAQIKTDRKKAEKSFMDYKLKYRVEE